MKINYFSYLLILLFLLLGIIVFSPIQAKEITIRNLQVIQIIDGDTIWVKNEKGNIYKVRFLGINAPEFCTHPMEPFALEAKNYVEKLLKFEKVYLKYNVHNYKDKYNRILGHIYREKDDLWISGSLVKVGLAYVYILNPHILYLNDLLLLENQARKNKMNIWHTDCYMPIQPEEAKNFIDQYKIIIGKVHKVSYGKNTVWLELRATNYQPTKVIKPSLSVNSVPIKAAKSLTYAPKTVFSVRIDKKIIPYKIDWDNYIDQSIIVRGYINQHNKNMNPFVDMVNVKSVELFLDS